MLFSSMSLTTRRQAWPNHIQNQHPLRRYKSLYIENSSISSTTKPSVSPVKIVSPASICTIENNFRNNEQSINGVNVFPTNNTKNINNNREKFSTIKNQNSVDQILNNNYSNKKKNQFQQQQLINNQNDSDNLNSAKNTNNKNSYNKSEYLNQIVLSNTTTNNDTLKLNNTNNKNEIKHNDQSNKKCIENQNEIFISKNLLNYSNKNDTESNIKLLTNISVNLASDYYAKRKHNHCRSYNSRSYGDNKKEKNSSSTNRISNKPSKGFSEDKVNLNIFLSQNVISSDIDDDDSISSDEEDNSNESNKTVKSVEIKQINEQISTSEIKTEEQNKQITTVEPVKQIENYSNFRKPLTATARRALFRASKDTGVVNYSASFSPPGCKDSSYKTEHTLVNNKTSITNNKININSNTNTKTGNLVINKRPPFGITRVSSALINSSGKRISSARKTDSVARFSSGNRVSSAKKSTLVQGNTAIISASSNNSISCNINTNRTSEISAAPSLIIEKRPPLIRAMSAPIRTLDENSKNILANKRKPRRRKILTRTQTTCINNNDCNNNGDNKLIASADNYDENEENFIGRNRNRKTTAKNQLTRSRSTIGIDVVTLVSLISSEESDSEKEDHILSPKLGSPNKRAPTLRKAGKSVSFQENQGINTTREYSHMIRRGSIAPLAAKLRSNRPPTAPPVSIFMTDIEQRSTKMEARSKNYSKEDLTQPFEETNENSYIKKNSDEETYQYPEFVKSLKERECWKLFQTMTNKGVAVSYETVLRGLLTPTELRQLLAKRRDCEMAEQRAREVEIAAHEEESKKNFKNKTNN